MNTRHIAQTLQLLSLMFTALVSSAHAQGGFVLMSEENSPFGRNMILRNDTLVVGAGHGATTGAFIFRRLNSQWVLDAKLEATQPTSIACCAGGPVAFGGRFVLIPVAGHASNDVFTPDSIFIYAANGNGWMLEQKVAMPRWGERLYGALAVTDTAAFFSTLSGIHRLRRIGGDWIMDKITETDFYVGRIVLAEGLMVALGPGRMLTFRTIRGRWKLVDDLALPVDEWGLHLGADFDGNKLLLGATGADAGSGLAYVYEWTGSGWRQEAQLSPLFFHQSQAFGSEVDLSGNYALVSSRSNPATGGYGNVYLYKREGEDWIGPSLLHSDDPAVGSKTWDVAIDDDVALVLTSFAIVGHSFPTNVANAPGDASAHAQDLLGPIYPNPSSSPVHIPLWLQKADHVRVIVYDAVGREVALLHEGTLSPGYHDLVWDGTAIPAGVYYVQVTLDRQVFTRVLARLATDR